MRKDNLATYHNLNNSINLKKKRTERTGLELTGLELTGLELTGLELEKETIRISKGLTIKVYTNS